MIINKFLLLFFSISLLYFRISTQEISDLFKKLPVIETQRLILRKIELSDANDLFETTSNPEVTKLSGVFKLHTNITDTQNYIIKNLEAYKKKQVLMWSVIYKQTNKVIGIFSYYEYSTAHSKAEIEYAYSQKFWSKGIGTEVLKEMIKFGFERMNLNRIQATCDPRNIASSRVLEKAGMKYEGLLREFYYLQNNFCHRKIYSLLRKEIS